MKTPTIADRIARCIEIQRLQVALAAEEKEHKAAFIVEAEADPENHAKTDGGGWSCTFIDREGNVARVTQPGRALRSKISKTVLKKIVEIAGAKFDKLFTRSVSYKPVAEFRVQALAQLDKSDALKLITAMTTTSAPTVSFEVKEGK